MKMNEKEKQGILWCKAIEPGVMRRHGSLRSIELRPVTYEENVNEILEWMQSDVWCIVSIHAPEDLKENDDLSEFD